ncbi:hypothetical protein [Streptomyces sp. NPDC057002]|uniref:hypothetical protein n=1 Tax=Streptomyces sp. NPDC057002 TaxID=3345992 RepID=UPI003638FF23
MVEDKSGDDARLLSLAYVEFFAKGDRKSMRLMERDARLMARLMGNFALFLMDAVVIPVQHGISWTDGWVEVDYRSRTDPEFKATLIRRGRYRRLAKGYTLRPKRRLRRTARDAAGMLCMAWVAEYGEDRSVSPADAVVEMLGDLRPRFCQTGDAL